MGNLFGATDDVSVDSLVRSGQTATPEQIRTEFRRLVLQHHPDKGGDPAKFRQIVQAYKQLTSPSPCSVDAGVDIQQMTPEELMSWLGNSAPRPGETGYGRPKLDDTVVPLVLARGEAARGVQKKVQVNRQVIQKGSQPPKPDPRCLQCNGSGWATTTQKRGVSSARITERCACVPPPVQSTRMERTTVNVRVEPGAVDGHRIFMPGLGDECHGADPGDLIFVVEVRTALPKEDAACLWAVDQDGNWLTRLLVSNLRGDLKVKCPKGTVWKFKPPRSIGVFTLPQEMTSAYEGGVFRVNLVSTSVAAQHMMQQYDGDGDGKDGGEHVCNPSQGITEAPRLRESALSSYQRDAQGLMPTPASGNIGDHYGGEHIRKPSPGITEAPRLGETALYSYQRGARGLIPTPANISVGDQQVAASLKQSIPSSFTRDAQGLLPTPASISLDEF